MRCRTRVVGLLVIGVSFLSAGPSHALAVTGRVVDEQGEPVVRASVLLRSERDASIHFHAFTNGSGAFSVDLSRPTAVTDNDGTPRPSPIQLGQNYPNPFNPTTALPYVLAKDGRVRLVVYDILGQPVRALVDAVQPAGSHTAEWDGTRADGQPVGAGVYLARLTTARRSQARKMVLVDGAVGPISHSAPTRKQALLLQPEPELYTAILTGPGIVPVFEAGMAIGSDTILDFEVERFEGPDFFPLVLGNRWTFHHYSAFGDVDTTSHQISADDVFIQEGQLFFDLSDYPYIEVAVRRDESGDLWSTCTTTNYRECREGGLLFDFSPPPTDACGEYDWDDMNKWWATPDPVPYSGDRRRFSQPEAGWAFEQDLGLTKAGSCHMKCFGVRLISARVNGVEYPRVFRGLAGSDLKYATLHAADLRAMDLRGKSLVAADLSEADLTGANLEGCDLRRANLSAATLVNTRLSNANLADASFVLVNLSQLDLSSLDLRGATFRGATLIDVDLSSAKLRGARFIDTRLENVNLEGADLSRAYMIDTWCEDGSIGECVPEGSSRRDFLAGATSACRGCCLSRSDLSGRDLTDAQLRGAALQGADVQGADLTRADLREANLRFANLADAILQDVDLDGARLGSATWIDGRECGAASVGQCH